MGPTSLPSAASPPTSWSAVAAEVPELAARVRGLFDARKHKTMATLRRDGSPRISGTEAEFSDGDVRIGMMPGSVKLADVRRDPRLALHSPSADPPDDDPSAWSGEAKIAGRVVATPPPASGPEAEQGAGSFVLDIAEVVLTYVGTPADHLVIESWRPGRGYARVERR